MLPLASSVVDVPLSPMQWHFVLSHTCMANVSRLLLCSFMVPRRQAQRPSRCLGQGSAAGPSLCVQAVFGEEGNGSRDK